MCIAQHLTSKTMASQYATISRILWIASYNACVTHCRAEPVQSLDLFRSNTFSTYRLHHIAMIRTSIRAPPVEPNAGATTLSMPTSSQSLPCPYQSATDRSRQAYTYRNLACSFVFCLDADRSELSVIAICSTFYSLYSLLLPARGVKL